MNIVHCDIKPENLMFNNKVTDSVFLIDFGFSYRKDITKPTEIYGTPYYMSPKLIFQSRLKNDFDDDMWSAGITLILLEINKTP